MNPTFKLVLKSGPNSGQVFPLETSEIIIGRDINATFVINDPEVSRRHARLSLQGVNYIIEDLGSTNGTMVSGQRLAGPYILRPGEMITLGEHTNVLFESLDPNATVASLRPMDAPAQPSFDVYAAPAEGVVSDFGEEPISAVAPVREYAGKVPSQPRPTVRPRKKKKVSLVVILIILVAVLACGCIAFAIFDALNLYCEIPGVMNFLIPGACPP
jgi:pSer/pThr/pTyr-binding forkhead associated (FHA) protein